MSTFGSLEGLRALVTGASSGIGRAISLEFASAGANVVVHCNTSVDAAKQLRDEIQQLGRRSAVLTCDISQPAEAAPFVEAAWSTWDGLDLWVNNAGVDLLTGNRGKLPYEEKLQRLLDGDVRSSVILSKLVGERMKNSGGGSIINVGWDQSDRGMEGDSGELFSTAKNAVMGFTRSLAVSLAPQVRVNCIAPGWIRTAWGAGASNQWQERVLRETPMARWGRPEDIAKLARFLASPDASYVTGQVWNCNGGAIR